MVFFLFFFANVVRLTGTKPDLCRPSLSFSSASLRMRIVERKSGEIGSYRERKARLVLIALDEGLYRYESERPETSVYRSDDFSSHFV